MTCPEAYEYASERLSGYFDNRELHSVLDIVFEDVFHWKQGHSVKRLSDLEVDKLEDILNRLLHNEPLQYILGQADFYGYVFNVNPEVLIPRPETEELVYWVLETLQPTGKTRGSILDIGTGSGCIPITLQKKLLGDWEVFGMDVSKKALAVAAENAKKLSAALTWICSDILNEAEWPAIPNLDVVISNPPYIPPSEKSRMGTSTLLFEPSLALFAPEEDPLIFYRKIAAYAKKYLDSEGLLFLELNDTFAIAAVDLLKDMGFEEVTLQKDMQGSNRMIRARK